jgi:hypothetical protein
MLGSEKLFWGSTVALGLSAWEKIKDVWKQRADNSVQWHACMNVSMNPVVSAICITTNH